MGNGTVQKESSESMLRYSEAPYEFDPLYKKYFFKFDLKDYELANDRDALVEGLDYETVGKKLNVRFDAVVANGILAKGIEKVVFATKAAPTATIEDKFGMFADAFKMENLHFELKGDSKPLNILFIDFGKRHSPVDLSISIADFSKATINEFYISDKVDADSLAGVKTALDLGMGSRLELNEIHYEGQSTSAFGTREFAMHDNSELSFNGFYTGGKISRQRTFLKNAGNNAKGSLNEVFLGSGEQRFDVYTKLENIGPKSQCIYGAKIVMSESAYAIIKGMGKVFKGAEGSESDIKERGLIYDRGAKITLMPDMSIDENYVKASHSSATSPISEDEIFYLASRGISGEQGKLLISSGILYETINKINSPEVKAVAIAMVKHRLSNKTFDLPRKFGNEGVWV